jgi:hypothetical protein
MFSAPHTATARRVIQKYSLKYDGGTTVFTAGATLSGVTSHATATIFSTGSAASGTLVIYNITGTFQNNEVLVDNGGTPGAAVADGTTSITLDSYGQPSTTTETSTISCRFFGLAETDMSTGKVIYGQDNLAVMLPTTANVDDGDTLTSTDVGYADTFRIVELKPAYSLGTIHHYTSRLARVS